MFWQHKDADVAGVSGWVSGRLEDDGRSGSDCVKSATCLLRRTRSHGRCQHGSD